MGVVFTVDLESKFVDCVTSNGIGVLVFLFDFVDRLVDFTFMGENVVNELLGIFVCVVSNGKEVSLVSNGEKVEDSVVKEDWKEVFKVICLTLVDVCGFNVPLKFFDRDVVVDNGFFEVEAKEVEVLTDEVVAREVEVVAKVTTEIVELVTGLTIVGTADVVVWAIGNTVDTVVTGRTVVATADVVVSATGNTVDTVEIVVLVTVTAVVTGSCK